MKIIDRTNTKRKEEWKLGDVLTDGTGHYGLIVEDGTCYMRLMDITPGHPDCVYRVNFNDCYFWEDSLKQMKEKHGERWYKVNAKLILED